MGQFTMVPSVVTKVRISTVAAICLFFLVLPSMALAAIVWWGATAPAKGLEAAGYASASPTQTASQSFGPPRNLQEATGLPAVSNAQSDIVIHKVKTQPIGAGTWEGPVSDGRPQAENSATD